jgi:hypothetical protein
LPAPKAGQPVQLSMERERWSQVSAEPAQRVMIVAQSMERRLAQAALWA